MVLQTSYLHGPTTEENNDKYNKNNGSKNNNDDNNARKSLLIIERYDGHRIEFSFEISFIY